MFTRNLIILLVIIGIAFIIMYIYYDSADASVDVNNSTHVIDTLKPKKKVKFNDYVEERFYQKDNNISNEVILSDQSIQSDSMPDLQPVPNPDNKVLIELDDDVKPFGDDIDQNNVEDTWDTSFGLPLMNPLEKKKFFQKMQQNHKKFGQSMSEFMDYKTDRSTIIKTETTIDPFKPDHRSEFLKGKPISDIYDSQVSTIKAKPKNVKRSNKNSVEYEDESELNGGKLSGSNLLGFDGVSGDFKTAAFGNAF